jgi:tetratricopeptide (TPR) repeat protein
MTEREKRYQDAVNQGHSAAWDQNWERAASYYRQALGEKPDDPKVLTSLALALFKLQAYDEALQFYIQAYKLAPQDPVPLEKAATLYEIQGKPKVGADVAVRAAELYLKSGDVEKAIENWSRALSMNPEHLGAHSRLAVVYERMQRIPQAVREYIHIASLMQYAGERDKAIQAVNLALKISPNHAEAQQALALLRENVQIPKPAKPKGGTGPLPPTDGKVAKPLLSQPEVEPPSSEPNPIEEAQQKALATLATLFFEQSSDAVVDQKSPREGGLRAILNGTGSIFAKNVDKNQLMLHLGQAVEYLTFDDHDRAATELKKVTDLGLNHPAAYFLLGLIHFNGDRLESALRTLKKSVLHPDYALSTRLVMAEVYQNKGQFSQAALSYLEALSLADAMMVDPQYADTLRQLYEPIIESHEQTSTEGESKKLIKTIAGMLVRPHWRTHLKGVRNELVPEDDGAPTPLAEVLTEASSSQVVVAIGRVKQLVREGHHRAAFEEAMFALHSAPTYLPLHITLGDLLVNANQIPMAITKFQVISRAYSVRGESTRAIEMLQRVVDMSPLDLETRNYLVDQLIAGGQITEAVETLIKLAEVRYSLAELNDARKTYVRALQLIQRSELGDDWQVRLLHRIADIDIQRLNWRQALTIYEQICAVRPDDMNANYRLIELNLRLGEKKQATASMEGLVTSLQEEGTHEDVVAFLERLSTDWPQEASLKVALAEQYQLLHRTDDALQLLDEAGEILLDAGDRAGAAEVIQRIIVLNPQEAERYRQLLGNI